MRRPQLEHVIRAAADVVEGDEIVVVGSQAILAEFPDAPDELLVSQEADVYPRTRPERAIDIDGSLGDGSQFHATFGYYAHGVGPETAKAPAGWEQRLVRLAVNLGRGREAIGWCMEVHDVVLAKCAAGRERDWEFAEAALRHRIVAQEELLRRVVDLPLRPAELTRTQSMLRGVIARADSHRRSSL